MGCLHKMSLRKKMFLFLVFLCVSFALYGVWGSYNYLILRYHSCTTYYRFYEEYWWVVHVVTFLFGSVVGFKLCRDFGDKK